MWLSYFDKHYGICYTVFNIGKLVNALDKEEFRIKLEEINRLVEKKNYKDAMEVVDSIDWRRVKNCLLYTSFFHNFLQFLWIVCEVKMFRIIQCRFYICNLVKQSCTNFFNSPLYLSLIHI